LYLATGRGYDWAVTPYLLAAVVSMTEMPSEHPSSCVRRALQHCKAAAVSLATRRPADDREKTAVRTKAPLALPSAVFRISPLVCSCATYVPPALAPRAAAATPSSQRDPPDSLA
jgi:hypothetical protein